MYDLEARNRALSLLSQGLAVAEVSRRLSISRAAIRDWQLRVEQERPLYAPRVSGASCPRCAEPPTSPDPPDKYAYLLGPYLGDGAISPAGYGDKGVWRLRISCADAWPGLKEECVLAVRAITPGNTVQLVQASGCTEIGSYSKHGPCLFPQHGPGKKHTREIALQPWQQEIVERHPQEFVRGLIHSDGCRITNRVRRPLKTGDRWYEYPRYFFTNESTDIKRLLTDALDSLGISWKRSRATRGGRRNRAAGMAVGPERPRPRTEATTGEPHCRGARRGLLVLLPDPTGPLDDHVVVDYNSGL